MDELMQVGEAARRLGVHRNTLVRWEREGHVTPLRGRGGVRFCRIEDVERLREWRKPKPGQGEKETVA